MLLFSARFCTIFLALIFHITALNHLVAGFKAVAVPTRQVGCFRVLVRFGPFRNQFFSFSFRQLRCSRVLVRIGPFRNQFLLLVLVSKHKIDKILALILVTNLSIKLVVTNLVIKLATNLVTSLVIHSMQCVTKLIPNPVNNQICHNVFWEICMKH